MSFSTIIVIILFLEVNHTLSNCCRVKISIYSLMPNERNIEFELYDRSLQRWQQLLWKRKQELLFLKKIKSEKRHEIIIKKCKDWKIINLIVNLHIFDSVSLWESKGVYERRKKRVNVGQIKLNNSFLGLREGELIII